ncbi:MAG TPA: glycosyltransferase family 4 protein [Methylomirabilota bacterium]|nr:glycosyltransferase family 4 protein [Methylomirabilota bacterium]
MRILFVSTTVPYPLNTGANQRIYHVLRALSRLGHITFACPTDGGRWPSELDAVQPLFQQALLYPNESFDASGPARSDGLFDRLSRLARYHGHLREPALIRWYRSPQGAQVIADACQQGFDLIWVERLISIGLLPGNVGCRVILDLDDVQYRKLGHRLRRTGPGLRTALDLVEFFKLRRMERGLVRHGPHEYVVCSALDKQILGGESRIWVVPNGIEMPTEPAWRPSDVADPSFVFVGAMSTEANVDAVHFFVRQILPRIRRVMPRARTLIVGSRPTPEVLALHDGQSVVVTGTVPAVEPFLQDATMTVVPIRFGGGTRIKILEALAHGVPVVSTRIGAEGLEVEHDRHLLLADTPEQFADACIALARDGARRSALSREGLKLVQERYDWRVIEHQVQQVVAGRSPVSP